MKTKYLYIAAGIISLAVLVVSFTILYMNSPEELFSENAVAVSLMLISVFFMSFLFFKAVNYKAKLSIVMTSEQPATESEEESAKKTRNKKIRKEDSINAKELGDKLFTNHQAENTEQFGLSILSRFAQELNIVQGLLFLKKNNASSYTSIANYAFYAVEPPKDFEEGVGISGQAAKDKRILNIKTIPEGYITVLSGLGSSSPQNLLILPFVHNDTTIAVLEAAAFESFPDYIEQACKIHNETIAKQFFELMTKK